MSDTLERLCIEMHDRYEEAAGKANWQTNPLSRKPWADVPEASKVTMREAIGPIADELDGLRAALKKHGEHRTRCPLSLASKGTERSGSKCTCGLVEVLGADNG